MRTNNFYSLLFAAALALCFFGGDLKATPEDNAGNETPASSSAADQSEGSNNSVMRPGVVVYREGQWLWSDNLLNLPQNLEIAVEFAAPDNVELPVTSAALQSVVAEVFKKSGIFEGALPEPGEPNLPSFHVLIMVYPIPGGYTFTIDARLIEAVRLNRIKLDPQVTMQAITWERTSIHVVSSGKFKEELESNAKEAAQAFADRYTYFKNLGGESQTNKNNLAPPVRRHAASPAKKSTFSPSKNSSLPSIPL